MYGIMANGTLFIFPLLAQVSLGWTATQTGAFLISGGLVGAISMIVVKKAFPATSPKVLMTTGLVLVIISLIPMGLVSPDASKDQFFWPFIIRNIGVAFVAPNMMSIAVGTLRGRDLAQATGLSTMTRQLGGAIGVALISIYTTNNMAFVRSNLVGHVTEYNTATQERAAMLTQTFASAGYATDEAARAAHQVLDKSIISQQTLLSYNHGFIAFAFLFVLCIPVILLIKTPKAKKKRWHRHIKLNITMKRIIALLFNIIAVVVSQAQTATNTLTISLNEAIQIGLKNRFDIKANQYNINIAETRIRQARNNWWAELSGDGQIKYSPQLQNSVIPGGVLPGFEQTTLVPLIVKNETVLGLNLSQPIYNANLINDSKLAKNQLALQQEKNRAAEIEIMLTISQAYLNAGLRGLQKRVAGDMAKRNKEYEAIAEGMVRNGTLIENHYLRAKLDRENADQLQQQAGQNYALTLLQLLYQLNLPDNTTLQLSDSLGLATQDQLTDDQMTGQRTEIRQLEIMQEENKLNLKKYQQTTLPSVSVGANYSQQFLSNDFNYGKGRWWSPFSYFTLNIHIPISAHVKNKAVMAEYRQKISQHELMLLQKKADINYEVQQARTTLANAVLNMKSARSSYELSKTILQNQQQQYRLGAFDYTALLDTEKSVSTTERNYIQNVYELILAQIQLQKATNHFNTNQ
ncbi:MFS transporter [Paraflavitalea speifideaquila]|uniref:MFS transporter n=1 Tax=Paraflavitalea speifideaquila TaxID=3076558 RepID=UPI003312FD1B